MISPTEQHLATLLVPLFREPFVPDTAGAAKPGSKKRRPCKDCGGRPPEDWPFVCMACHAVAPEHEAALGTSRSRAKLRRELERNVVRIRAREMMSARIAKGRPKILRAGERARLVAEMDAIKGEDGRSLGDDARAWLDSIGQPAPEDDRADVAREATTPERWRHRGRDVVSLDAETKSQIAALNRLNPRWSNARIVAEMKALFGKVISPSQAQHYRYPK